MYNLGGWCLSLSPSCCGSLARSKCFPPLSIIIFLTVFSIRIAAAQVSPDKHVLIINEVGLSHSLTDFITQQIVEEQNPHVEFHSESLDLISSPDRPSRE